METDIATSAIAMTSEPVTCVVEPTQPIATIACLAIADITAIFCSLIAAALARNTLLASSASPSLGTLPAATVLVLCSLTATGLYPGFMINPVEELRRSTLSVTIAFLGLWAATFLLRDLSQSRLTYVLACILTIILIPLFRAMVRSLFSKCDWWGNAVAILGYGVTGKRLLETLTRNPKLGLKPIAILDDNPEQYIDVAPHLISGPLSRCREIAHSKRISYGIICMPGLSREELLHRIDHYGSCFSHILIIPNLIGMTSLGISAKEIGGVVGLEVKRELLRPSSRFAKRLLDLALTVIAAPVILFLVAVFAALTKLEGSGPAFYANERIGYGGKTFRAWKLRSMVVNSDEVLRECLQRDPEMKAEWETTQKLKYDPRLTPIGRIIRKTSIDELPQFWNVLRGEMSVVGPRPMLQSQVTLYGPSFALYTQVRPGITGLWQVSGRNHLSFAERVKLDRYVIQNWSVWLDLYILARTASVVLTGHGAY